MASNMELKPIMSYNFFLKIGTVVMFASVLWLFMCLLYFTHDNRFNYLLFFQNGGQNCDKLKFTTFK